MKMPYDTDAHWGFLVLQSTQVCTQKAEVSFALQERPGWVFAEREIAHFVLWSALQTAQDFQGLRGRHTV